MSSLAPEEFETPTKKILKENDVNEQEITPRRSSRKSIPTRKRASYEAQYSPRCRNKSKQSPNVIEVESSEEDNIEQDEPNRCKENFGEEMDIDGKAIFGFHTPKKRDGMASVAATACTPKTPKLGKTPDTKRMKNEQALKTPKHVRNKVRKEISKLIPDPDVSGSDFSAEESEFEPESDENSQDDSDSGSGGEEEEEDEEQPTKARRQIVVPVLPKTPSAKTTRTRSLRRQTKSTEDYIPESDGYFRNHHSSKFVTSDHTLDRIKNQLPADRLFSLLSELKLSSEHEEAVSNILDEYKTYFTKWLYILNEGYNILLYGLGSKRNLLQNFHRDVLNNQTVIMINGFFPSLTIKDILNSITSDVLELTSVPGNPHDVVNMIEEEFALLPESHLYLIIHNIDGAMLRNSKSQEILSRLANIPNIHMLASIDHINTPLIWDQKKLSDYNFSWWDCTTMLPYTDETAYENSLMVQNTGDLALSSMRNVFQSLTTNAKGIYILIVKHQLKNKGNLNYQGMVFKDLYWGCREAFLVSSDLALRAQLTEFLDHKMIRNKRSVDGAEQLIIPIDSGLLQQFLDEHEN